MLVSFCGQWLQKSDETIRFQENPTQTADLVNQNHLTDDKCMIITFEHEFECDW